MRERIPVSGMTAQEIVDRYHVHRSTAYRAIRRGYVMPRYHEREVNPDPNRYGTVIARFPGIGRAVFCRYFAELPGAAEHLEDLLQEAALRCLELSGNIKGDNAALYLWKAARNAMWSYLARMGITKARYRAVPYQEEVAQCTVSP